MTIFLASPRGFCAGVTNAITGLDNLIKILNHQGIQEIYAYHEIVHNNFLTESFIKKGVIFVNSIDLVPDNKYVVFSAHGVSPKVEQRAIEKNLIIIDLTCPLVHKVHKEAKSYQDLDLDIIYIGDEEHQESKGTLGYISNVKYYCVYTVVNVKNLKVTRPNNIAYVIQTTLNVDKVKILIDLLKQMFPNIKGSELNDICHATKNRQAALQKILNEQQIDLILVVGSQTSSNSNKLAELGSEYSIPSYLIDNLEEIQDEWLKNVKNIAISAGASVPENLVYKIVEYLKNKFDENDTNDVVYTEEKIIFHPPKNLRDLLKIYSGDI